MKRIPLSDCRSLLCSQGRTVWTNDGTLYCNWSHSGIRFSFTGSSLSLRIKSIPAKENERIHHPWLGVVLDDGDTLEAQMELAHPDGIYSLFQSEKKETHTITLIKLTENNVGKMELCAFLTDGEISAPPTQKAALRLEFIGDSITCGFGNMVNDANRAFFTQDENAWFSHAAIAARKLHAQVSLISCSGIALTEGIGNVSFPQHPMGYYYPWRDRFLDDTLKNPEPAAWDFRSYVPDVIVLNLGTNDSSIIALNKEEDRGIELFKQDYLQFLHMIREKNGPKPYIICALGSMDYFLYNDIQEAVKQFTTEHHDERIRCFKYHRIRPDEGIGACYHPYVTTQQRMGEEIADYIRNLLG